MRIEHITNTTITGIQKTNF